MNVDSGSLLNWNEVNKKFAEEKAKTLFFKNILKMSPVLDVLCYLLLIASGAIIALMLGNIDTIIQIFGLFGFKIILFTLVVSIVLGFSSKYNSVMCQVGYILASDTIADFQKLFDDHQKEADGIMADALNRGIEIDTEMDTNRVMLGIYAAVPKWCFWIKRSMPLNGNFGDSLHRYVRNFIQQGAFLFLQVLMFGAFMMSTILLLSFYN